MRKYIYAIVILILISVSQFSIFITSVNRENINYSKEQCKMFELLDVNDEKYVTREEFLESILRLIGLNGNVLSCYMNVDYSAFPTYDFDDDEEYNIIEENTNIDDIEYYAALCRIAQDNNIMQVYCDGCLNEFAEFKYQGKEYITFHDAVAMSQACISEINAYNGMFKRKSFEHYKLLLKAHNSGILSWRDTGYWSVIDTKLSREDLCVLLSRLLNKKRYHYILDTGNRFTCMQIDKNRDITYKEFLER